MKKSKKTTKYFLSVMAVILALVMAIFAMPTFAWLNVGIQSDVKMTASVHGSYFESGDGTENNPYEIARPIQLYYFAWLQQLGYFNEATDDGTQVRTTYFYVSKDLDMQRSDGTNYVLPPAGTLRYPFVGNFDGKGHVISNLTVSNDALTDAPARGETGVQIIGFFGVVGSYSDDGKVGGGIRNAQTGEVTPADLPYDSATLVAKDFYLKDITVETKEPDPKTSVIGIVAGYVNGEVSGVGVCGATVTVASGISPYTSDAMSDNENMSNYGLVGYCADDQVKNLDVNQVKIYETTQGAFEITADELGASWGGSIAMESMFKRIGNVYTAAKSATKPTYVTSETYNPTTGVTSNQRTANSSDFYNYTYSVNGVKDSSYSFSKYGSSNDNTTYYYLYGVSQNEEYTKTVTYSGLGTCYTLSYSSGSWYASTYYLSFTSLTANSSATSATNATKFIAEGDYLYTYVDGAKYYLTGTATGNNAGTLSLTSTATTKWTYSNNRYSTTIRYGNSNRTYYLYGGSGSWTLSNSTRNTTRSTASTFTETRPSSVNTNPTYFPLNSVSETNYAVNEDSNTGYVIAGSQYKNPNSFPNKSGDIRISQYAATNIYKAMYANPLYQQSGYTTWYTDSRYRNSITLNYTKSIEVITRTAESGGYVRIKDNNNQNHTAYSSELPTATIDHTKLQKYDAAKNVLDNGLNGKSTVYGLHFMDATIDKNSKVVAPRVKINGEEKLNYEMPTDAIDFHLKAGGYINFFAGTYFSGNDSFFSLHHIIRNKTAEGEDDVTINDIKEISKIYKNLDEESEDEYIYLYADDNTYSDTGTTSSPNRGEELFDMKWITEPDMIEYAVYYFEIPANKGEYALGSVDGGTGAYLFYLDISGNAQDLSRVSTVEKWEENVNTFEYFDGAAFVSATSDEVDSVNNANVKIASGFSGSAIFERSGLAITQTGTTTNISPSYLGENVTYNGSSILSCSPKSYTKKVTYRETMIDRNKVTDETTTYVATTVDTYSADGATITREITFVLKGETEDTTIFTYSYTISSSAQVKLKYLFQPLSKTYTLTIYSTASITIDAKRDANYAVKVNAETVTAALDATSGTSISVSGATLPSEEDALNYTLYSSDLGTQIAQYYYRLPSDKTASYDHVYTYTSTTDGEGVTTFSDKNYAITLTCDADIKAYGSKQSDSYTVTLNSTALTSTETEVSVTATT